MASQERGLPSTLSGEIAPSRGAIGVAAAVLSLPRSCASSGVACDGDSDRSRNRPRLWCCVCAYRTPLAG